MDPIEYLRLYMTMWEQWLQKYETYKYHGDIMRCKKGIALIPIYKGSLQEKHPPIYYQYNYTGDETYGFVKFWLYRNRKDMLVMGGNSLTFRCYGSCLPYDLLFCLITDPKSDGSFSAFVQFEDVSCGVFQDQHAYVGWAELGWSIPNPFGNVGDYYSKWGYCPRPYIFDFWWWRKVPNSWSFFYTFNWRYYPISHKYDYWDNIGNIAIGKSVTSFQIGVGGSYTIWSSGSSGGCHRLLGVNWSGIAVYSGVYTPPP